jgi:hypothetical protein
MRTLSRLFPPLLTLLFAACSASGAATGDPPHTSRDVLTREDLRASGQTDLFTALSALRPTWLQVRGPDSFSSQGQVQVYRDDVRVGGVDMLRGITITDIAYVRHFDGISASARWGLDHGHGVIFVVTAMR